MSVERATGAPAAGGARAAGTAAAADGRAALEARVRAAVEARSEEAFALLEELVAIDSTNPDFPGVERAAAIGGEARCAELLRERYARLGLSCELVAPDPERPNLVAALRGAGGGRALILNGHMDTVAPVRPETWSMADPHAPERRDGRLFGLGATDMKGGLVSAWLAVAALRDAGASLTGDLEVHCVVGEEQMQHELGTSACLAARGHGAAAAGGPASGAASGAPAPAGVDPAAAAAPVAAIVLEPSSSPRPLTPSTTSAGNWVFRVTIHGRATHAGNRGAAVRPGGEGGALGANAVEKGLLLVQALQQLEAEWGQTRRHPAFAPGFFTINPGAFHADAGAPSPAYLADRAELDVLAWYPPGEDPEAVKAELERHLLDAARLDPWLRDHPPELAWLGNWPAAETPWDAPVAQALRRAHERVTGELVPPPGPAAPSGFPAVTDASFLEAAGIPAVVYGPGDLRRAHAADEHVALDEVMTAAAVVALAAIDWCGVSA
jgi:acetylornithine deacetylase/succinyl-diaminopimelate desuccinylase-like protein